jgi:GYF domain
VKHGPFTTTQMLEWWRQGFFRGDYTCPVRRVGDTDYCSSSIVEWEALANTGSSAHIDSIDTDKQRNDSNASS